MSSPSQVLKKRLSVNVPMLMCGNFMYEEGEGLEEDEVEANAALLPRALALLPGGGLGHGSILNVSDESQHFSVELIISHRVRVVEAVGGGWGGWDSC